MTKYLISIVLLTLKLSFPASGNENTIQPFTSQPFSSIKDSGTPGFHDINACISNNKILLNWKVAKNETVNLFEIEKSTDGKKFILTALVFGTDQPAADTYKFFEKATGKKIFYRIKLISKTSEVVYSKMITINRES